MGSISIATVQLPITGDPRINGEAVRAAMSTAAAEGARLVQFPEGMLSGYAKNPILDWAEVDWDLVRSELAAVCALADQLNVWVVLGSAHQLTEPNWPHNSLYVISDHGQVVDRYDKRFCSHTETTRFYTPGTRALVFEVDGFKFGCIICVEINFPKLFIEYDELGVDCVLFSAYPVDSIFAVKARAHAAIHNYWISLSTPSDTADFITSTVFGPDGEVLSEVDAAEGVVTTVLDREAPEREIALTKARPWRSLASRDASYYGTRQHSDDPRSSDRTCV